MLKVIRRRHRLGLAAANRTWLRERLDNVAGLVDEIRALPPGTSASGLTARLLAEAQEADSRACYVDELTEKAGR